MTITEPIIQAFDLRKLAGDCVKEEGNEEVVSALDRAASEIVRLNNIINQSSRFPEKSDLPKGVTAYTRVETVGELSKIERVEF